MNQFGQETWMPHRVKLDIKPDGLSIFLKIALPEMYKGRWEEHILNTCEFMCINTPSWPNFKNVETWNVSDNEFIQKWIKSKLEEYFTIL